MPGVAILGRTMDADHNRSVITFAGNPEAVAEAAIRAVAKAAELIDLRTHSGVHPRLGATDVLPFVPVEGVTMEECVDLARAVGEEIWTRLKIPVYFYENAARHPERKRLEDIRRGQFETLRGLAATDPERRPDVGGPELHSSAGATIVGARPFLIAYNINLDTEDVSVARNIAKKIRTSSGGYPNVKALGMYLSSRKQSQVSMNLTDFRITPVHVVFEAVREHAEAQGVRVTGSEIIGLIPKAALEITAGHYLRCENFSPEIVLENKLAEVLPYATEDFFSRPPAGNAAALAGALASSLGILTARSMNIDPYAFIDHCEFFRASAGPGAQTLAAVESSLRIADRAHRLHNDLRRLAVDCPQQCTVDLATAMGIALSAKSGAIAAIELNLPRLAGTAEASIVAARLGKLK
jgi:glutamate formiminotransferase